MDVAARTPSSVWLTSFVALWLVSANAFAIDTSFLEASANTDGSIATSSDNATAYQATAEAALTLQAGGANQTIIDGAMAYLDNTAVDRTAENLSLLIVNKAAHGLPVVAELDELLGAQNENGGFGSLAGYDSTPLDTAHALQALAVSGWLRSTQAQYAVGYLINKQALDGSWSLAGNTHHTNVEYTTAVVLRALWHYRNVYTLAGTLDGAQDFLLNRRSADGAWSELDLTALSLIAILPRLSDLSAVQAGIDVIKSEQLADKSWNGDVYTTALLLRVIDAAENPVPNPDLGSIRGRIINAETGEALSGHAVALSGAQSATSLTDVSGVFQFVSLAEGQYQIDFSAAGFGGFSSPVALNAGAVIDLGTIALNPLVIATTVTVRGLITRQDTGGPLSGVRITANGLVATTGTDGKYQINDVPPGTISLSATRSGFVGMAATADAVAGATIVFSPSLSLSAQAPRIQGTITDVATGAPLQGAQIRLTGANDRTILTNSVGSYLITALLVGKTYVQVEKTGYAPVSTEIDMESGGNYDFSPALALLGQTQTILQGTVVDKSTGNPLGGAVVNLSGANVIMVQADSQGRFRFVDLSPGETVLTVSHAGYGEVTGAIIINEGDNLFVPIELLPEDYVPPTTKVTGKVVVEGSGTPIPGAIVEASLGDEHVAAIANTNGVFELEGIGAGAWSVHARRTNYNPHDTEFIMPSPPIKLDLGVITLTEKVRFPDLTIQSMDRKGLISDPANFNTAGILKVTISNIGRYQTANGFEVIAYYDTDLNGVYNATVDQFLGAQRVEAILAPEDLASIEIPINTQLPFRDAPIRVRLDTQSEVAEMLEDNNDGSTCELAACGD